MTPASLAALPAPFVSQPADVRELPARERDALIINAAHVDGSWVIRSRYGDDVWYLDGFTTNTVVSARLLNFDTVPLAYRATIKAILYRYLRRGRTRQPRPKGGTVITMFVAIRPFLRYLEALEVDCLSAATPSICATYVQACRDLRQVHRSRGKPLSQQGLMGRFSAVEALFELSQYTPDPMPLHPWPDTSARGMAGMTGWHKLGSKTPLIPDIAFCTLFERAYSLVKGGRALLDLRDARNEVALKLKGVSDGAIRYAQNHHLAALGWEGGQAALNEALTELRTACYIVLASTSGCRNHELANVQSGAHHRTIGNDGTLYHWMRSRSDKTDTGVHDWMIPEAAVRALRVMESWAEPHQAMIAAEIAELRRVSPHDSEINEAQKHRHALFLGVSVHKNNQARTLSVPSWTRYLKAFAKDCGLDWELTSHQYRRKFASYAAHSRFGDLRYLKEHFAHWSMDMTLGYAIDEGWGKHFDLELYTDIHDEFEDIKLGAVDNWLSEEHLSGGYGRAIKRWQREPENLLIFKDHASMLASIADSTAIRSNGHAWCTADNDGCVGNTLERTRCGGCDHAVIGRGHAAIYQRLYGDLKELLDCSDIGEGGRQRVLRDLKRSRQVLMQLGLDPEAGPE